MKNKKGFTIVELVIVISVIAVLAGVLIPTFSGIVKRASVSSDTQAVRNMNVVLTAESAESAPPVGGHELIVALKENGFSEFRPQTKFYTFYWIKNESVIILANEDGDPVFPEEYAEERYDPNTWINLEEAEGMPPLPTAPSEDLENPRKFTVSVTVSGGPQFEFGVPTTVTEGEHRSLPFVVPEDMQIRYQIKNVTALMEDGEETHRINVTKEDDYDVADYPDGFSIFEIPFTVDIPCVTGNIEIHVTVKEYCKITVRGNNAEHLQSTEWHMWFQKGGRLHIPSSILEKYVLNEGYEITSAVVSSDIQDFGEAYDKEDGRIHSREIIVSSDITIEIITASKT